MLVITDMIFYNLKVADNSKIICGSASEAEYAFLRLWHYIVFSRWLNGNVMQRASLRHASTAYCLAFFSLLISCGPSRNKVWGWRISLSRCTYLISVLPALLLLRFIDQDDCILCPLLCKSGRGKGSFAEMWVLRAGPCLSMHSQLASSLWCSVIKIIKWVKWSFC